EKSATNIYDRIQAARRRPLGRVINALGIPHVGWTTSEDLAQWLAPQLPEKPTFGDVLRLLRAASVEDLQSISGIGEVVAKTIEEHLRDPEAQRFLEGLCEANIVVIPPAARPATEIGAFAGKTVVFTGTLE